jgi:hypothetical protein
VQVAPVDLVQEITITKSMSVLVTQEE